MKVVLRRGLSFERKCAMSVGNRNPKIDYQPHNNVNWLQLKDASL